MRNHIRIAGASGFWGDTAMAVPQLLTVADLDFLVFDYLAEVTLSIMAAQKAKSAEAGYARDFVDMT
ncbi:MAG: acyclic terpene utilization AtuA family protein, partial [Betaproteobacteria bacterium]|nr:acyclic terpene utilization AtuA family protein [Betaproteobacteria bacterium]